MILYHCVRSFELKRQISIEKFLSAMSQENFEYFYGFLVCSG